MTADGLEKLNRLLAAARSPHQFEVHENHHFAAVIDPNPRAGGASTTTRYGYQLAGQTVFDIPANHHAIRAADWWLLEPLNLQERAKASPLVDFNGFDRPASPRPQGDER